MHRIKHIVRRFLIYLVLISLTVTFSLMLFTERIQSALSHVLTQEELTGAAIAVFKNVFVITLLFTIVDYLVYRIYVERKLKAIRDFTDELSHGTFGMKIRRPRPVLHDDFDFIMDNLDRLSGELQSIEVLRNDFIATVSHEFKTPLAIITNYAELLRWDFKEEYVERLHSTSSRLSALVADVLALAKLESQQLKAQSKVFSLSECIREILITYEERIEAKGLALDVDLEEVEINSDENLITIMISNIITNAVKFTDQGGVRVSLFAEDKKAILTISDTGSGIDSEALPHIFDRYYRSNREKDGNGLGLALVRRIADMLSIEISVESAVGKGTSFTLAIPLSPEP